MSYFPSGGQNYTLNSSISSTQSTITLTSFTVPVTGTLITMAVMGTTIAYGTIQPKTSSSEFISFTGVTQNADGTATLTGVTRGLDKNTPYTSVAGFKLPHSGQSIFILSDMPALFNQYSVLQNAETVTGIKTFATGATPLITDAPTTNLMAVNKAYADGLAIAGAPDSSTTVKGIGKVSVAPASATSPIFVGDNDTRVPTANQTAALVGNNTDIAVGSGNKMVTQTGLQHNAEKYAADTSGSTTAYVVTLSPVPTSYTAGMIVYAKIVNANTTTVPTINVNSLGAKTIVKTNSQALAVGDIAANMFCTFIYDGTNMVLQNPVAIAPITTQFVPVYNSVNTTKNVADASTTQTIAHGLGKTPKYVRITCLCAFGSAAPTMLYSNAVYNGTTQVSQSLYMTGATSSVFDNTFTLNAAATNGTTVGVVTFDATNISIAWTKTNSPTGTYQITAEAFA